MKPENQFAEVVQLIKNARSNAYRAINVELINCYWQVGEYISKRISQSVWGDRAVIDLAKFINHLIILARAKTAEEKEFYIRLCIQENYGKRELDRQISSSVFEQVMMGNLKLPIPLRSQQFRLTVFDMI